MVKQCLTNPSRALQPPQHVRRRRALYGTDGTKNAIHGSDSFASALREVNFCFNSAAEAAAVAVTRLDTGGEAGQKEGSGEEPKDGGDGYGLNGFATEEKTLALIKPGVSELHSGEK